MSDPMRKAFEEITFSTLNIAGSRTGHGLRRKENGEYFSDLLEDHWNTFQEGWEAAREACARECEIEASVIVTNASEQYQEGRSMGATVCANTIKKMSKL